ncbi:hypothetical protein DIPPA_31272 [Diplonema papillatum]|nr:hypothetical protein DIPPA_31272 [Diplonema papillatum]
MAVAATARRAVHLKSDVPMSLAERLEGIMKRVRLYCLQRCVRVEQFLQDFDRARSGLVTRSQFRRALHMSGLTNILSEDDYDVLFAAFLCRNDVQRVRYAQFADAVGEVFTKKGLEKDPSAGQTQELASKVLSKDKSELSENEARAFDELFHRLIAETRARGLVLKTCFIDFDRHRSGKIPQTQFERSLPFKMNPTELAVTVKKYFDAATRNIDYQSFANDINAHVEMGAADPSPVRSPIRSAMTASFRSGNSGELLTPTAPGGFRDTFGSYPGAREDSGNVARTMSVLKQYVRQHRIRLNEVLSDYDKLRSGFISVSQFKAALGRLRLHDLPLTNKTLDALADVYSVSDSQGFTRVAYTRFLAEIDQVFTIKGLEKDPSKSIALNPKEYLNDPSTKDLPSELEAQVDAAMDRIRTVVKSRRILLKPMFQDFDRATRGVYQTRKISKTRFERVLALNNISISPEEAALIEAKYEAPSDPTAVNYVLFCAHVDSNEASGPPVLSSHAPLPHRQYIRHGKTGECSIDETINDIRRQVLTERVRISEFLRDFDKLRRGIVSEANFASGLNMAKVDVDAAELSLLAQHFACPKQPGFVRWVDFCDLIDEVHTTKRLEANPGHMNTTQSGVSQRMAAERAPTRTEEMERILDKLRETVRTRGIVVPPFFKDFDRRNTGLVTANRLGQALTRHAFDLSQSEIKTIVDCYRDPRTRDVCYRKLIADMDETERPVPATSGPVLSTALSPSPGIPVGYGFTERMPDPDLAELLEEIRMRVCKERIRIRDFFLDADRLRKGVVTASKFRTGLDIAGVKLNEYKLNMLEGAYGRGETVDYVQFSLDVSPDAADRDLEKNPNKSANSYRPGRSHPLKSLKKQHDEASQAVAEDILARLRVLTATRRILLKPVFLDFDRTRRGCVSPSQFAAALDRLQMKLTPEECQALVRQFENTNGDVCYSDFCVQIDS